MIRRKKRRSLRRRRRWCCRRTLRGVAFNNITCLAFGKRFEDDEGRIDEKVVEFKAIVSEGIKFGALLAIPEYIPLLRWMFPLDEGAYDRHTALCDPLTRASPGAAKHHFIDALLTLQPEYELSDNNVLAIRCDPGVWESPEEFRPERFMEEIDIRRHNFRVLPFGAGRRACPGALDIKLVASMLGHWLLAL